MIDNYATRVDPGALPHAVDKVLCGLTFLYDSQYKLMAEAGVSNFVSRNKDCMDYSSNCSTFQVKQSSLIGCTN
jgi:hypothetical protein